MATSDRLNRERMPSRLSPKDAIAGSTALKTAIGASPEPYEQEDYQRDLTAARTSLGADEFGRFWAEGQVMTREQAVEYALGEPA